MQWINRLLVWGLMSVHSVLGRFIRTLLVLPNVNKHDELMEWLSSIIKQCICNFEEFSRSATLNRQTQAWVCQLHLRSLQASLVILELVVWRFCCLEWKNNNKDKQTNKQKTQGLVSQTELCRISDFPVAWVSHFPSLSLCFLDL